MVQRLFQEEAEHEGNEQMEEDSGEEVTPGQSLQHHQSVRHKTFSILVVLPPDDCE